MGKAKPKKRGQKTCIKCNKQVGARTRICACGHQFGMKARKLKMKSYEDQLTALRQSMESRLMAVAEEVKALQEEKSLLEKRLREVVKISG